MSLATGQRFAYAAPAFALAIVGIPVFVYIPKFYTDVVGVDIAMVGLLLLAVRLFDAVTDPAIGFISDRTSTRWGRRRPYIFGASIPLAISLLWLFTPPETSAGTATVWFGVGIFALFLFWTLVTVPYESLGPELTFDYNERTALLGLRDGMLLAGTLAAAASPAVAGAILADGADERARFFWIAVVYGPLLIIACGWCAFTLRERAESVRPTGGLWTGLGHVARNRPFIILLVSYTIAALGSSLPATLILYYVEYVLESQRADLFLLLYFIMGIVFLPAWVMLARRVGKKEAWLGAIALNTGAFVGVFFLGPGDEGVYGVLVALSGVGLGATLAIPSSMQADVIDYDELMTGERREGQYVGFWSIAKKLAAALGVGAALALLGTSGYEPNVAQTPRVQLTLRTLYALIPCVCNAVAFMVALAYPINQARHRAIRAGVRARRAGRAVADPLNPATLLPRTSA